MRDTNLNAWLGFLLIMFTITMIVSCNTNNNYHAKTEYIKSDCLNSNPCNFNECILNKTKTLNKPWGGSEMTISFVEIEQAQKSCDGLK